MENPGGLLRGSQLHQITKLQLGLPFGEAQRLLFSSRQAQRHNNIPWKFINLQYPLLGIFRGAVCPLCSGGDTPVSDHTFECLYEDIGKCRNLVPAKASFPMPLSNTFFDGYWYCKVFQ